eukprot:sb/3475256/
MLLYTPIQSLLFLQLSPGWSLIHQSTQFHAVGRQLHSESPLLQKMVTFEAGTTTNQNSLFRSLDWLSANQGPVFPDSVDSYFELSVVIVGPVFLFVLRIFWRVWTVCMWFKRDIGPGEKERERECGTE